MRKIQIDSGPHQNMPVEYGGEPLIKAKAAMIMVHGRGADARDILSLAAELNRPGFVYLAPNAHEHSWYPNSFLAPIPMNEPGMGSGMQMLRDLLAETAAAGIPTEKVMLLGFSQGACICLEYVARHPKRYGGVAGLSGGLIGPPGTPRDYPGSLGETPVFLGCSTVDFHIPAERVQESTRVLRGMGANVTERLYAGMGHTINMDEIRFVRQMMDNLLDD